MQKKIDLLLKILLVIWFVLVLGVCIFGMPIKEFLINDNVYTISTFESLIIQIVVGLVIFVVSLVSPPFVFITIYLLYRMITQNKIRQNAKFEKENLEYCRDHLNKLSPGIISYLKNFSIEKEKDISAHILKLLYEGYLIEKDNVIKKSNKNTTLLTNSDLEIIRMVEEKDFSDIRSYELEIEKEAKENGLLTSKNDVLIKFIGKFIGGIMLIPIIIIIIANIIMSTTTQALMGKYEIIVFLLIFILSVVPIIIIIYSIASSMAVFKYKTSIIRTPKGNKLVKNIYGLEKFLKDFSNLEKASYKEVYTRDYFLIYSVVLGINKEIPKEIMKK